MSRTSGQGWPATIVTVAGALIGLAVALYNYLTPLTGVTGTFGAGLVTAACLLIGLAAILAHFSGSSILRAILRSLAALGAVLTALAGYFLHEWWLIAAMGVVILGLIYGIARSRAPTGGALA